MSIATIRAALESRLNGISPALPTAWSNVAYTPTVGTAWQRVELLVNQPVDYAVTSDVVEQRGILQVTLFYPLGVGTATVAARAEAIRARFAPPQTLTSGGTSVEIVSSPFVSAGVPVDEWWALPVSIYWRSFGSV